MAICIVTSRSLKATPTPVVIFYHTIGGMIFAGAYILIEMWVANIPSRFLDYYTRRQYGIAMGAAAFDSGALLSVTFAFQSATVTFVSMLSYLNVVYAFITDLVVWQEKFSVLELFCTLIILVTAVSVAVYKFK